MSAAILNTTSLSSLTNANQTSRTKNKHLSKFLLSGALATALTVGLFSVMEYLIRIDQIEIAQVKSHTLTSFIAETATIEDVFIKDDVITKIEPATPPPAAPTLIHKTTDGAILGGYTIAASTPDFKTSIPTIKTGVYRGPTKAIPIRSPLPTYPNRAQSMGISGSCEVAFSLSARGEPFNMVATCTHPAFVESAERAVGKAAFSPTKNDDGMPVITHNVVWPLEYKLN